MTCNARRTSANINFAKETNRQNRNIMEKKLRKSSDKMIAGVCAGIAEYFDIDPTLARVGYVILSLFCVGFPGVLLYIVLMLIMPDKEAY